jgi:hypothetical protein
MSFNLGVSNSANRLGNLSTIPPYLYESVHYRAWITEVALAFLEGRQDEFIYLDLVREFRNPEKQQILPVNLTKEIIDETSILYKEAPIYRVVDENGKALPKDQKLWEEVMRHSRYLMLADKLDRWTRLLGTVLVKVSFIDENTGFAVSENNGGKVQLDLVHGGVYDVKYGASPYHLTELLIGFGNNFMGFGGYQASGVQKLNMTGSASVQKPQPSVNTIYWSPTSHKIADEDGREELIENPYGI